MNDLISRKEAIKAIEDLQDYYGLYNSTIYDAINKLKNLPPAQKEVVRCRECIYADGYNHCKLVEWWNVSDDFCSRGEKREDDIHTEHSRSSEDDWDYLMQNAREKLHEQLKIKADGD